MNQARIRLNYLLLEIYYYLASLIRTLYYDYQINFTAILTVPIIILVQIGIIVSLIKTLFTTITVLIVSLDCVYLNYISRISILLIVFSNDYPGFQRIFEIISLSWYIKGLTRQLRIFIYYFPESLILQLRRHQLYDNLQSIELSLVPFYILIIIFMLILPTLSKANFDLVKWITDIFTNRVTFQLEYKT